MNTKLEHMSKRIINEAGRSWKGLYCISGILLIVIALISLYAVYLGRILYSPGYPSDAAGYLQLISQHQSMAATDWSLWILMDFLGLAPIAAIYLVLQQHNRTFALAGGLLAIFYAIYDVSATELNSLTLVSLSHGYALASTEVARASIVTAATYGYHALPLQTVLSFGIGSLAYLLWCVPMWNSFFGRWTTIMGVIVNVIGVIGSASPLIPSSLFLGICFFLTPRIIALWFIVMGIQLYLHGRRLPEGELIPSTVDKVTMS